MFPDSLLGKTYDSESYERGSNPQPGTKFDRSSNNGNSRTFGFLYLRSNRSDRTMRGSYSGQYGGLPDRIREFESLTPL